MPATSSVERARTVVYEDALGERFVVDDWNTGGNVEVLKVSSTLAGSRAFEFGLRERVARLSKFRHPSYLTAHRVDALRDPSPALAVVSPHVDGIRLSELLRTAHQRRAGGDIGAALEVIRQLLPPIALLHEFAPEIGSGLIAPERLMVTAGGHLLMVDQALGGAIGELRLDRDRLWRELRIPTPAGVQSHCFTQRGDIVALGLVALALAVGRPLDHQDLPEGPGALLEASCEPRASGADRLLIPAFRGWLERALQLERERAFASVGEAWVVFSKTLPIQSAPPGAPPLEAFAARCTVAPVCLAAEEADGRSGVALAVAPRLAQDPAIHVEMLPPPDARGDLTSHAVTADDIDWTSAAELPLAVASSRDISALLAEPDDVGAPAHRPAGQVAVFEGFDTEVEAAADDAATPRPPTFAGIFADNEADNEADTEADTDVRPLAARLAALSMWPRVSRTVLATVVVTMLAVSVVWASLRAPASGLEQGTVVVQTNPAGLRVLIDGVEHGLSPARVRVSPGDHLLEVRGAGGERVVPVTVVAGKEVSHHLEFSSASIESADATASATTGRPGGESVAAVSTPAPLRSPPPTPVTPEAAASGAEIPTWGWLAVKGPFPLEVRANGKTVGAVGADRIRMAVGRHEVQLVNEAEGYRTSRVIYVAPGKVTNLSLEKPATGTVSLNASPWAEVWIDGRRIGETPLANVIVSAGRHEVVFRHPQFGEKRQEITVVAGETQRVTMGMQ